MGCDIHFFTEVKYKGSWKFAGKIDIKRDYCLFAKMANIRNEDEDIEPITIPRGIPSDCDDLTRLILCDDDLHSHSYLSSEEFEFLNEWYNSLYKNERLFRYVPLYYPDHVMTDNFKSKFPEIEEIRFVFAFDN